MPATAPAATASTVVTVASSVLEGAVQAATKPPSSDQKTSAATLTAEEVASRMTTRASITEQFLTVTTTHRGSSDWRRSAWRQLARTEDRAALCRVLLRCAEWYVYIRMRDSD